MKGKLSVNALESQKSLYDLVVVDSAGIEMNFAKDLEKESDVVVCTKLPGGFYINTPVGHYNPDRGLLYSRKVPTSSTFTLLPRPKAYSLRITVS